jgi:hypothetical protein
MTRSNEYQDRALKAEARIKELEARDVIRESAWAEQIKRYQGELASARVHIKELEAENERLKKEIIATQISAGDRIRELEVNQPPEKKG